MVSAEEYTVPHHFPSLDSSLPTGVTPKITGLAPTSTVETSVAEHCQSRLELLAE